MNCETCASFNLKELKCRKELYQFNYHEQSCLLKLLILEIMALHDTVIGLKEKQNASSFDKTEAHDGDSKERAGETVQTQPGRVEDEQPAVGGICENQGTSAPIL